MNDITENTIDIVWSLLKRSVVIYGDSSQSKKSNLGISTRLQEYADTSRTKRLSVERFDLGLKYEEAMSFNSLKSCSS